MIILLKNRFKNKYENAILITNIFAAGLCLTTYTMQGNMIISDIASRSLILPAKEGLLDKITKAQVDII